MVELGGLLAAAILKVVSDQIGSALGGQIKLHKDFTKNLEKMKMTLESVDALLEDAERRSITDKPTCLWLKRLKVAMYAISDMIDEFESDTEAIIKPSARKFSLKRYLATVIPCLTIGPKITIANKMEKMREDLEVITEQHREFKFSSRSYTNELKATDIRETSSIIETQVIVGRTEERDKILCSLSESMTKEMMIIPIYGIGGLGKTTLAKMVYNSSQFKDYSQVWVYVSQTFDLKKIGNSIISQLSENESQQTGMQMIQNSLSKLLAGKKVLIILDDLWEDKESHLDSLKAMLKVGKGSKVVVVVTTRAEGIAQKVCTIQPHKLEPLTDDMCWSIIKQKSAFESRVDKEHKEQIGMDIAMKCGGVALAAQSIGHMLHSLASSEWESVRNSDIWNIPTLEDTPSTHVLASLRLSYSVMPRYLKLCFAYCAIFPKGHKIMKDDIIHQWVSLGFIEPTNVFSFWQLGERYIRQLLGLSFLQDSKAPSYTMKSCLGVMLPCLTMGPKIILANKMKAARLNLAEITAQHKDFNLLASTNANELKVPDMRETSSKINELIFGRTKERDTVLDSLCKSMTKEITILPIYGIGGIGKTTLAQMIYSSSQFRDYSQVWVYVSQIFDLKKIGNSIISQLLEKESQYSVMEMVQNSLYKLFAGKKILIVLDDLWEENKVDLGKLKGMLNVGNGSNVVVIVTTRRESSAMGICSIQPHNLALLSPGLFWSIIKHKSAFKSRDDKIELKQIGKDIGRKCGGVALAAQSLGYVMQSMTSRQWNIMRDSDIWSKSDSKDTSLARVFESLRLSYSVMPACLKLCFAYCAIFPKGHMIVKDDLIQQWLALGFIEPTDMYTSWELGEIYIRQLLGLSFLQNSGSPLGSSEIAYTIKHMMFCLKHYKVI